MPGYYQRPMAGQLPLTPPDSGSGYGYSNMHYTQDPYSQPVSQCRPDNSYDYQQGYMQPAVAPAPPTYQFQHGSFQQSTSLPPIQTYYEPIGAPILPPLRIHERVSFTEDYQRRLQQEQQNAVAREQQRQAAKEDKATGGVSAKLDYEMERMTDFVTEAVASMYAYYLSPVSLADIDMTQSFQRRTQSPPSFRKWVHQVLSATRLPSATILLSLHYMNDRLVRFPDSIHPGDNQIYRLLAVSLILGSKFLDDNTFINRSWSDVTAIRVSELNLLEIQWLEMLNWKLHVDPDATGPASSLKAWMDSWQRYDAEQSAKQMPARLSPLDTNVHRHAHNPANRDRYSPYPSPYTASSTRSFDQPLSSRQPPYSNPYSTVDSWAPSSRQADDFYKRSSRYDTSYAEIEATQRATDERTRQAAYQYASQPQQSYYQPTSYGSGWENGAWGGMHRYDCNCTSCAYQNYRPYAMASGYSAQTVMG
jgi:hypothetical protein